MIQLQPIYDNILVKTDGEWRDQIQGKNGVIGIRWLSEIDRSIGAITSGVVVNVPRGTSQGSTLSKIHQTIQIGDKVYFHFNSISEDTRIQFHPEDPVVYKVHMESIFCIVREGKIIMYGDRVLCEPVFDNDVITLEDGMKVKKSKSGIITEINVEHNIKKATLSHISASETSPDVTPGDTIFYDKDADFENEIEGKKYFCMIQKDILMKEV